MQPPTPLPDSIANYITSYMPTMDGWCWPGKAEALARAVLDRRPSVVLEIGVFAGRSLIATALALQHLAHGHCYGIDPWTPAASTAGWHDDNEAWWKALDHDAIYHQCLKHIAAHGLAQHVSLLRCTSDTLAPLLRYYSNHFIDLLHIDGNHSEEQSMRDVQHYLPLCTHGATICFDDIDWSSTKAAQQLLQDHCTPVRIIDGGPAGKCAFYTKL